MKPMNTIKVGTQPRVVPSPAVPVVATATVKANNTLPDSFNLDKVSPFILFPIAIVIAIALKFLGGLLLVGAGMGFAWKEILSMVFAFMISAAFGSIAKKSKIATAIAILLILITASNLARHDYSTDRVKKEETELSDANIVSDKERVDFLLYGTGKTYTYTLKAGEETPWRGFQPGIVSNYFVSSENLDGINYDYTIFYSDGTTHKAGPEEALPAKKGNIFLKIRANSAQTVYVTVF